MFSGAYARNLAGAAIAIIAFVLALILGAPVFAAALALIGGLVGAWLLGSGSHELRSPENDVPTTGLPPLPGAADLLEAVDEPLLIVRNRRVLLANTAARSALGSHIEGGDVRLAIRHPAAAELFAGDEEIDRDPISRTELVGLGEVARRWVMTTSGLADGSRLVRLTDRSESHASEKMRTDFVANASHELRTPLATLLGFLETLQDESAANDRKARSRFLKIMFDEARRMQQLVEDLISLSRIEAERFTMPRESVDLLPLIDELRTSCRQMLEEKQSTIVVRGAGKSWLVLGDRPQLLQLLRNLVVNALKYGRPQSDIVVEFAEVRDDMLRVSVIDKGEGIAPEHLPRLTERFYRVDPGRSRAVGGTGLGLAIVKHIVGRHRGSLEIRSTLGEGKAVHIFRPKAGPQGDSHP